MLFQATHVVCKELGDDSVPLGQDPVRYVGEVVDARRWRTTAKLVTQGWIVPIPPNVQTKEDEQGRWWIVEEEGVPEDPVQIEEYPKHAGGPWYVLSDGSKVKGKAKAAEQEAALQT